MKKEINITLLFEFIAGIVSILLSLTIFIKLADSILEKETIIFDSFIMQFIYNLRHPALTLLMQGLSFLGGQLFLGIAICLTIIILWRKDRKDAFVFSFILFMGAGLNSILKDIFHRPRPNLSPLVNETSYSFPSGHAMNSFIFYTCLSYFLFRKIKNRSIKVFLSAAAGILIFLIGVSRIYLGVHYPSDVVAGYLAGLIWFLSVLLFEKTLISLHKIKKRD